MASGGVCSGVGCNLDAGASRPLSLCRFPRDPQRCHRLSDRATKRLTHPEPDAVGPSRAAKRKRFEDPSCPIHLEMLNDAKLMLTPLVVLERVTTLPQLKPREIKEKIKENPKSQPEDVSQNTLVTKIPGDREDAVKQLKLDLQKLKDELDKERAWHKNLDSYVEMVERKRQKTEEKSEVRSNSHLQKEINCEALFASPFWIKVEEASDAPDKKVYYVFNGINSTLDPGKIKNATVLPVSSNGRKKKDLKSFLSTSETSPQNCLFRKSHNEKGAGRLRREIVLPESTLDDASKSSPRRSKNKKSNKERGRKRKTTESMVMLLTTADGKVKYRCVKCSKCFLLKKNIRHHISAMHSHILYECASCCVQYRDKRQLNIHLKLHHSQHPLRKQHCHICGRKFSAKPRLDEHVAFHMQKMFACSACKTPFVEADDLKRHLPCPMATFGMPGFLCLKCDETFVTRIQILRHFRGNHSPRAVTANAYKKLYLYSNKHEIGMTAKFHGKHYECENCDKTFRYALGLGRHLPCDVKICEVCRKQFENGIRLDVHLTFCHSNQAVKCSLCGALFVSQRKLYLHENKFKGQCQGQCFMCNCCGQSLKCASSLDKHMQTHDRKMPGTSKKYSITAETEKIKRESDLECQLSGISDTYPVNAKATVVKPETDIEFQSSGVSCKCPADAGTMVKSEFKIEFHLSGASDKCQRW